MATTTSTTPFLAVVEELTIQAVMPGTRAAEFNDYRLLIGKTTTGMETTCLCCASNWGHHFDHLRFLVDQTVKVYCTEGGLKLRPLEQQPLDLQMHWLDCLERWKEDGVEPEPEDRAVEITKPDVAITALDRLSELASTVAHKASELGMATAMWIHLPE